jgi:hypothetical protein
MNYTHDLSIHALHALMHLSQASLHLLHSSLLVGSFSDSKAIQHSSHALIHARHASIHSLHAFLQSSLAHFSICPWQASMQASQLAMHALHSETQFLPCVRQLSEQL